MLREESRLIRQVFLKRFILTKEPDKNGLVRLEGADYHYLVRVRRLATGEYFPALFPGGAEALVRICSVEDGVLTGECTVDRDTDTAGPGTALPPVILFQALPKGDKMDLIVRQAAEGAITEIVPFVSEFSIPRIKGSKDRTSPADSAAWSKKTARWERIIKEARQQSGSPVDTLIRPPLSVKELFAYWEELKQRQSKILGLLFHHIPLAQASLHGYLDSEPEIVTLAIGPEGGFAPSEVSLFLDAGFKALTIGKTILRTETAALYGAAAIRIILLERNSWEIKPRQSGNG